jgi:hypothetical protein
MFSGTLGFGISKDLEIPRKLTLNKQSHPIIRKMQISPKQFKRNSIKLGATPNRMNLGIPLAGEFHPDPKNYPPTHKIQQLNIILTRN